MSTTYTVTEIPERRKLSVGETGQRTYRRTFRVVTTNKYDGAKTIAGQVGIRVGEGYDNGHGEKDPWAVARKFEVQCVTQDGLQWEVEVEHGPWEGFPKNENPLLQPVVWILDFNGYQKIVDEDIDGNPIVNTAGDRFDPPVLKDDSRPVLVGTKNYKDPHFDWAMQYRDTVNRDAWYGFDPRTVKLKQVRHTPQFHVNVQPDGQYWALGFEFDLDEKTFDKIIRNQGLARINQTSEKREVIIMPNGAAATEPQPLDETGDVLVEGGTVQYLNFRVYNEADWSIFGLDNK